MRTHFEKASYSVPGKAHCKSHLWLSARVPHADVENVRIPKRPAIVLFLAVTAIALAGAQGLAVTADDLRIEQLGDGGYHLYVRARAEIGRAHV